MGSARGLCLAVLVVLGSSANPLFDDGGVAEMGAAEGLGDGFEGGDVSEGAGDDDTSDSMSWGNPHMSQEAFQRSHKDMSTEGDDRTEHQKQEAKSYDQRVAQAESKKKKKKTSVAARPEQRESKAASKEVEKGKRQENAVLASLDLLAKPPPKIHARAKKQSKRPELRESNNINKAEWPKLSVHQDSADIGMKETYKPKWKAAMKQDAEGIAAQRSQGKNLMQDTPEAPAQAVDPWDPTKAVEMLEEDEASSLQHQLEAVEAMAASESQAKAAKLAPSKKDLARVMEQKARNTDFDKQLKDVEKLADNKLSRASDGQDRELELVDEGNGLTEQLKDAKNAAAAAQAALRHDAVAQAKNAAKLDELVNDIAHQRSQLASARQKIATLTEDKTIESVTSSLVERLRSGSRRS